MMPTVSKKMLSESDICDQCITPAIVAAGWNMATQIRREFSFTAGRIIVRGQLAGDRRGFRRRDRQDGEGIAGELAG